MKRLLIVLSLWATCWTAGKTQLPAGSIAPDFTVTDINGQSHHLYTLLNQGKTVYLDFFATWCSICWNYHNGPALKTIWQNYGPSGTNEAYVIAIEGDPSTNLNCLYGPSGCNGSSPGNWTFGVTYPIASDASISALYAVQFFPTVFMICPTTKKVYSVGTLNAAGLWNQRTQKCELAVNATVANIENVRCLGTNTGKITLSVSGGTGPYSYAWSNGTSTNSPSLNDIPGGTYSVTITPAQGISTTLENITVEAPPGAITIQLLSNQPPGCNGVTGALTAGANGGWSNYQYEWNNGQTTPELTNISDGTYTVSVTDQGGCVQSQSFVLSPPAPITANIAVPAAICAQGTVQLNATAPTGNNITYNWLASNGGTIVSGGTTLSPTISSAGMYTLQVTNAQSTCTGTASVMAQENPALGNTITATSATCNGAANGTATVTPAGGNGTYSYAWSTGASTATVGGLAAGQYAVVVTDGAGCTTTGTVTVNQPSALIPNATATAQTANGLNNGTAVAAPTGGTTPYTYLWNNGQTTATITNLEPGNYTVVITDANGCTANPIVTVNAFNCVISAQSNTTNVSCFGGNNGTATVSVLGGAAPFAYNWSNSANTATATNLGAGTYTVTILDNNNCNISASVTITQPSALVPALTSVTNPLCPNETTGIINMITTGGTPPYTYLWNNGALTEDLSGVMAGTYTVVATDGNTCTASAQVTVNSNDTQKPVITANPTTLALSNNGFLAVTATDLNVQVSDNCGVAGYAIPPAYYTCDDLGTHELVLTATDASGNTATATVTLTVVDNISPVVICPSNIMRCANNNTVFYNAPIVVDNCVNGGTLNLMAGLPSNAAFPVGATTTQVYVYLDKSGNMGQCSFEVTVFSAIALQGNVVHATNNGANGSITLNTSGGTAPYTYLWSTSATTPNLVDVLPGTYTVQVTDALGCVSTTAFTVENAVNAQEPAWMTGMIVQPNPTTGLTRLVFAQMPEERILINILDISGRLMFSSVLDGKNQLNIDTGAFAEGMYLIQLQTAHQSSVRKLVVQR
jgi:hypothetical protein